MLGWFLSHGVCWRKLAVRIFFVSCSIMLRVGTTLKIPHVGTMFGTMS